MMSVGWGGLPAAAAVGLAGRLVSGLLAGVESPLGGGEPATDGVRPRSCRARARPRCVLNV